MNTPARSAIDRRGTPEKRIANEHLELRRRSRKIQRNRFDSEVQNAVDLLVGLVRAQSDVDHGNGIALLEKKKLRQTNALIRPIEKEFPHVQLRDDRRSSEILRKGRQNECAILQTSVLKNQQSSNEKITRIHRHVSKQSQPSEEEESLSLTCLARTR